MYKKPKSPGFAGAFPWSSIYIPIVSMTLGMGVATQYAAYRLGEQPALGPASFHVLGVAVYPPWDVFLWFGKFLFSASAEQRVVLATAVMGIFIGSIILGSILARIVRAYTIRRQSADAEDLHGSARFATKKDLERAKLIGQKAGLFVGGWFDEKAKMLQRLRHAGPESVCVLAPPRSGKGVSLVVPTLLDHRSNALVHDKKKELYYLTGGYRAKELGQRVLLFSPTEPETCGYNPLAEIRLRTDREVADAQNIVNLMVRSVEETGGNKHWLDVAESFGLGMVLHFSYLAREKGRTATLAEVYTGLSPFGMTLREYLEAAANYQHDPDFAQGWTTPEGEPTATHPVVRQKFIEQINRCEEEFTSTASALGTAFLVFSDPLVAKATNRSDFLMQDLMDFSKPLTVYLAIPPSDTKRLKPLVRLMFSMAIMKNTEKMDASRPTVQPHERLLLMIDEAAGAGKLDVLNESLAQIPGYHIQAYLIFHSIEQIQEIYGHFNNILASTHVRIAFAPNTLHTAREISGMTGETTIARASYSFSGKRNAVSTQMSGHTEYVRRALLTPDEVMKLRGIQKVEERGEDLLLPGDMLIFIAGHPPIFGMQTLYLADPELVRRSQIRLTAEHKLEPPFLLQERLGKIMEDAYATQSAQ